VPRQGYEDFPEPHPEPPADAADFLRVGRAAEWLLAHCHGATSVAMSALIVSHCDMALHRIGSA
jgi:hypothetical protein